MPDSPHTDTVVVPRTARYATLGTPDAPVWWMVVHGYGQQAPDLIEQCQALQAPNTFIVAPEALSRFYVDGIDSHEEVGASWMTKVAREDEITDYLRYLDRLVEHLRPDDPPALRVLGFSQGAATASRWALLGDTPIDRLVLWGGVPAHDLDLEAHADSLRALDLTLVVGSDDPYVTPARRAAVERTLAQHDIPVTLHTYEGGHHLHDDPLRTLADPAS